MDPISQLEDLKKIASELSIDIVTCNLFDSEINIKSGHCKLKQKDTIIIDLLGQLDVWNSHKINLFVMPIWTEGSKNSL